MDFNASAMRIMALTYTNESNNEEHLHQRWYRLMKSRHPDYLKMKKKFDDYFRKHPEASSE